MDDTERLAAAFGTSVQDLEASLDDWLGAPVPVVIDPAPGEEEKAAALRSHRTVERILPAPDTEHADKLLGRVRRLDAEAARIHEHAERRIAEVRAWEADMAAGVATERARVGTSLELFIRELQRAEPKRKTLPLVNGTLTLRASSRTRVDVTDEHALVRWCEANGQKDLLRYKPEPNKTALGEEPERRTHPDETIEDPEHGAELYHVWGVLVPVLESPEAGDGEMVTAEVPGVRVVQRVHDRFGFRTADELTAKAAEGEEDQ